MTQEIINIGSSPDAGDGDTLRAALTKTNLNFTELYGKVGDFPDTPGLQGQVLLIDISGNITWGSAGDAGTDAATLAGQAPSYYLNYDNFTNTPTITTTLAGLTDTSVATATAGQVLTYDGAVWTAQATNASLALNDLSNVSVAAPSNGQALVWNGSAWVAGAVAADLATSSIDALADVDTTTSAPANNQALVWNGTNWVPGTVSTSSTIGQLTDVDVTGAIIGSVLKYDGASWSIGSDSGAGTGISYTDLSVNVAAAGSANLAFNNTNGVFTYTPPDLSEFLTAATVNAAVTHPAQDFAYSSLTGTPTIPTVVSDLTNDAGYLTAATVNAAVTHPAQDFSWTSITGTPTTLAGYGITDATAVSTISDLTDVNYTGTPTTGHVLKWDGLQWAPGPDLTSDGGVGIALTDISATGDIDFNQTTGVISFNNNSGYITTISAFGIDSLNDVDTTTATPNTGESLVWNGSNWAPNTVTPDVSNTSIDALADVNTTSITPTNGQALVWNGSAWAPAAVAGGTDISTASIDELADVDTTTATPSNGQALVWDGSNFVPGSVASDLSTASIDELADVDTTTAAPSNGQALVWDGSNFVPGDVASVDGVINFIVTADGTNNFIFNGGGTTNAIDPVLYLTRGQTYTFSINTTGSPFYLKTAQTTGASDAYSDGVINNGVDSGTITFTVPQDAPDTLYYISQFYPGMTGTIYVLDTYTQADWNVAFATKNTDDLSEGLLNKWYTDERVDDRVNTLLQPGAGINLTYDDLLNTLTIEATGGGAGGSSTFLGLTDTPNSFSAANSKFLAVNADATAVEFADISAALWGSDVKGSVFGDDSSILVDATSNSIVGDVVNDSVSTDNLGAATGVVIGVDDGTQLTFGANASILGAPQATLGATRIQQGGITFSSSLPMVVKVDPTSASQNLSFEGFFTGSLNGSVNGTLSGDVTSTNTSTFNDLVVNGTFTSSGTLEGNFNGNLVLGGLNSYSIKNEFDDVVINEFGEVQNLNGQAPSYFLDWANFVNKPTIPSVTDEISETAGSSNLYHTAARARAALSAGTGVIYDSVAGTIAVGQDVAINASPTFLNMTVTGNLTVQGTTTTIDTTQLLVEDNIVTLNSSVTTGAPSVNAGIEVLRGDEGVKQFVWDESVDKWSFGSDSVVAATFEGNLNGSITSPSATIELTSATNKIRSYYATVADLPDATTYAGMFAGVQADGEAYVSISGSWNKLVRIGGGLTTDGVSEGDNNLYWTEARGNANFTANLNAISTDSLAEGSSNRYYQTSYFNQDFDYRLGNLLTSDIEEGTTNLYWTEQRFDDSFSLKTSDDLAEGINNYYFTNARFNTEFGNKTISDLSDVDNSSPAVGDVLQWNGTAWGAGSDFATIAGDLKGSVFADDSSIMVDGLTGEIKGVISNDEVSILKQGSDVYITPATLTDGFRFNVGVGSLFYVDGDTDLAGTVNIRDNVQTMTGVNILPEFDLDGDIGSAEFRYGNMHVGTITSNDIRGDVTGSVFAQDSTQIINDIDGTVVGDVINANTTTNVLKTGKLSRGWTELITNVTAEPGSHYIVDTSVTGGVTITLPAEAQLGDEIRVIDGFGEASVFNITIARNGHNIQGRADDLIIQTDRSAFGLVYYNAEQGWILTEN